MSSCLSIRVEIEPTTEDFQAACDLVGLANHLQIRAKAEFNGVDMFADPKENPIKVQSRAHTARMFRDRRKAAEA